MGSSPSWDPPASLAYRAWWLTPPPNAGRFDDSISAEGIIAAAEKDFGTSRWAALMPGYLSSKVGYLNLASCGRGREHGVGSASIVRLL
jgi:hypothetical protein